MVAWLLVLVAAAAAAAAGQPMSIFDMGYDYWAGPERGCSAEQGAGQLILSCTLPSGNLTLFVDRLAATLKIVCEKNSILVCDELREAKPHIDEYVMTDARDTRRRVSVMTVDTCGLSSESLACPLRVLNATETSLVKLQAVAGELEPVHVGGLNAEKFRMYDVDKNVTAVPFKALSLLPTLKSFSMKGGALVLETETEQENNTLLELLTLELAAGDLRVLPKGAFKNTPSVQTLLLWGNKIQYVDVDAFEGLTRLVNLSLNANLLSQLPGGLFRPSPRLGRVDLYGNSLADLPADVFSGLRDLREILIFDNKATLTLHNRTFSNLPSLCHLKLETCSAAVLPGDLFLNTTGLRILSLKGNGITTLPDGIFSKQRLHQLNLSNNSISTLPAGVFAGQRALVQLELQRNALESLPEGIFSDMESLQVLDLSNNSLKNLSNTLLARLHDLRQLSLARNRIKYLNFAVFEFTRSLETLSLAGNGLTISREENTIALTEPSYGLKANLTPPVKEYHSPFRHLVTLRSLDLSHNNVSIVCNDWTLMFHLAALDLSYNNFTSLANVDMNFSTRVTVDFRHNSLQRFQPNINLSLADAPTFLLDHNPYTCDCYMYDFISGYRSGLKMANIKISKAECARPSPLRGVTLAELQPHQLTCDVDCSSGELLTSRDRSAANSSDGCDECKIRPDKSRLDMSCQSLPETYPPLPPGTTSAYIKLRAQPWFIASLPEQVKVIDLSGLNLTRAPTMATSVALNLTNNWLTAAPVQLLERNCTVYLANNPFECSCEDKHTVVALNTHKDRILDYCLVSCSSGVLVASVAVPQLCAERDLVVAAASVALVALLAALLAAGAYRYSTEIRVVLRKYGLYCASETDDDGDFDAFISFAHEDEKFVTGRLLPALEGGRCPLRVCVHSRDWVVGDWIPEQIARSVARSRRTVVVLSQAFARSRWAAMEFRAAHGCGRAVVLLLDDLAPRDLDDPQLRAYLTMNTYVRADDPLVWDRLKDAVLGRGGRRRQSRAEAEQKPVGLAAGRLVSKAPPV